MFVLKLNKLNRSHFHPHGVVGRGSETQVQVDENINYLIWPFKGLELSKYVCSGK